MALAWNCREIVSKGESELWGFLLKPTVIGPMSPLILPRSDACCRLFSRSSSFSSFLSTMFFCLVKVKRHIWKLDLYHLEIYLKTHLIRTGNNLKTNKSKKYITRPRKPPTILVYLKLIYYVDPGTSVSTRIHRIDQALDDLIECT